MVPDEGYFSKGQQDSGKPQSDKDSPENILRVLSALRQNGISCFLVTDLASPELETKIKGEG